MSDFWAAIAGVIFGFLMGVFIVAGTEGIVVVKEGENILYTRYKGADYVLIPAKIEVK